MQLVREEVPIRESKEAYPKLSYEFLSSALLEWPRDVATRFGSSFGELSGIAQSLLRLVNDGSVPQEAVKAILEKAATEKIGDVIEYAKRFQRMPEDELREIVAAAVREIPDGRPKQLMGVIMGRVRGRADGSTVMRVVQEMLKRKLR